MSEKTELTTAGGQSVFIIWQDSDEVVPEQALLVSGHDGGLLSIQQGKDVININPESVRDLVKALRVCATFEE